jgi:hypothetical protein
VVMLEALRRARVALEKTCPRFGPMLQDRLHDHPARGPTAAGSFSDSRSRSQVHGRPDAVFEAHGKQPTARYLIAPLDSDACLARRYQPTLAANRNAPPAANARLLKRNATISAKTANATVCAAALR